MRRTLLALFAPLAISMTAVASLPAPAGNPSATGDYVRSNGTRHIFNAVLHKNGSTTGSLYSESLSGFIYTVRYDRVTFSSDGKSAYLHGIVTYANFNPGLVGRESIQKVTDNGEGGNATPDAVTAVFNLATPPPNYVLFLDGFTPLGIAEGNIQVRAN